MTKVKFIVEKIGKDGLFGITSNPLQVWGNLNKAVGISDMLRKDLKNYPPDSEIDNTLNIYQYIVFVRLYTSKKDAKMLFFDAQNDENKALDFYNSLKQLGADKSLKDNLMKCFYNIRTYYDDVVGRAELILESQE
jgi:hypothetical protein